jgi:hypothetical protein
MGRQVTHEAAGEGVAGPGGIVHHLDRVGRRGEPIRARQEDRSVLAFLDHDDLGSHGEDRPRRPPQIRLAGEIARLAVVQDDDVHLGERAHQGLALAVDPEVHGVAHHELRRAHLVEHLLLQVRIDVGEKQMARAAELLAEPGLEILNTLSSVNSVVR